MQLVRLMFIFLEMFLQKINQEHSLIFLFSGYDFNLKLFLLHEVLQNIAPCSRKSHLLYFFVHLEEVLKNLQRPVSARSSERYFKSTSANKVFTYKTAQIFGITSIMHI